MSGMKDTQAKAGSSHAEPRMDSLYRALVALHIHHDQMLWSRVQLLLAVQAAVIGGSYAIGNHILAGVFLLGGAAISLVTYELAAKDRLNRDANSEVMELLAQELLPQAMAENLLSIAGQDWHVRLSATPPKGKPFLRNRYLIPVLIWSFLLFDLFLATLHLLGIAPVVATRG